VVVPEGVAAMDVHLRARIKSPYHPHKEFDQCIPLAETPLATACLPVRVLLAPFDVVVTETSVETGKTVTEFQIKESTLMNADYQFAAQAWASVSYVIPGENDTQSVKTATFTDFGLHVEESVLAVFMAQSLSQLAQEHLAIDGEPPEDDDDYRVLIARAVLFQNLVEASV
jgi:hypothetical protein